MHFLEQRSIYYIIIGGNGAGVCCAFMEMFEIHFTALIIWYHFFKVVGLNFKLFK